jgi:predicted nicotinamide N-methyase
MSLHTTQEDAVRVMLPSECVLSDVHLRHETAQDAPTPFEWRAPALDPSTSRDALEDADGDRLVKRRRRGGVLRLHHTLETRLNDVGLQVWRGALLLADLLVAQPALVEGAHVLEVGSGCALCGLMAARLGAERVFVTDVGEAILRNAQRNARVNRLGDVVSVRSFDWRAPWMPGTWPDSPPGAFDWRASDVDELRRATLVLAADVIYDDSATDALLERLVELLPSLCADAAVLFTIERRVNFCVDSLSARSPALDHFLERLRVMGRDLRMERLPCEFAQAFDYDRVRELELYRVQQCRKDHAS